MGEAPTPASPEVFGLEPPGEAPGPVSSQANGFASPPAGPPPDPPQDPGRSPNTSWSAWTGPVALFVGLILTTILSLLIDAPAAALGAKITGSHTPPGLTIADTLVQDVSFVLVSL